MWKVITHGFVGLFTLACVFPFLFTIIISLTDENTLSLNGYSIFPKKMSTFAYEFIFRTGNQLFRSYGVTILITIVGTILSLIVTGLFAYAISRPDFYYRRRFAFFAFFPTLFNAGIVPTYIIMTQFLHLKDSIWALIMPLLVVPFNIFLMRSYFQTMVPDGIIEAARIDGCGELRVFTSVVAPVSLPIFATITLFTSLAYWNDWFNALLYIDNPHLVPIQYMLIKIQNNVQFLASNSSLFSAGVVENMGQLPSETMRMALVVFVAVPVACVFPFFQRYFIQGLTGGAVKE
nr:carbohydrate ABC transporter permease [Paenibacillus sp. SYP-B3998]